MTAGDEQWCHSWDYLKPDGGGETSKLNYRAWSSRPVWESGGPGVAKWIDWLDDAAMAVSGDTGGELGYKSDAQATGTTATHPLDEVLPSAERIDSVIEESDLDDVYETERHLLYVACTRARDRLLVSGVKPGSEFLADFG
jgi:hypothetical protein